MTSSDPAPSAEERLAEAVAAHRQGRLATAEEGYLRVLQAHPEHPDALHMLGVLAHQRGDGPRAVALLELALQAHPDFAEAQHNLGLILAAQGRWDAALACHQQALRLNPSQPMRRALVQCLSQGSPSGEHRELWPELIQALDEAWCNPLDLAPACMDLVRADPLLGACLRRASAAWPQRLDEVRLYGPAGLSAVAGHLLLHQLLVSILAASLELEWFLTQARAVLLSRARADPGGETALSFHCALARQCFLNEYVFGLTAAESGQVEALRQDLEAALAAGRPVPDLWPVALAAYQPLGSLAGADALLQRPAPEPLRALLVQQVLEPRAEAALRPALARLTPVDDPVSQQVRAQYEENPYPRWEHTHVDQPACPFPAFLRDRLPRAEIAPVPPSTGPDVLIAGCGTGRHPLETAQEILGARILAIDLSLASLAYAQRKSAALGLDQVTYAQADILNLGTLGRQFDLIEAVGVLHHLADPMAGWRVLRSLLRPGGFMNVGLYSQTARRDIAEVRAFIRAQGYAASAEDIRRCRQDLMTREQILRFRQLATSQDFFATSACRDLLFHTEEHPTTLPRLKRDLAELGLTFLGFQLPAATLARYAARFPADASLTDLDAWDRFEQEQPQTFRGMYQFWAQRGMD